MYTIVDIETTGGTARSHKIIEVAIVTFDGQNIVDTYSTLINPKKFIPPFITSLTGISNDMIEGAPGPIDILYIQKMQGDNRDMNAENLVPHLMALPLSDTRLEAARNNHKPLLCQQCQVLFSPPLSPIFTILAKLLNVN